MIEVTWHYCSNAMILYLILGFGLGMACMYLLKKVSSKPKDVKK